MPVTLEVPRVGFVSAWLRRLVMRSVGIMAILAGLLLAGPLQAADAEEAWKQLRKGEYEDVIDEALALVSDPATPEEWHLLLSEALLTVGRYPEAEAATARGLVREPGSIRLRWLAREAARAQGKIVRAEELLTEIGSTVRAQPWMYRNPENLLIFGRAALELGSDPKEVLDRIYTPMAQANPDLREVYLAKGDLALSKHDFALAATTFQEAVKRIPDDADLHYGLARAYENGDRGAMVESLKAALEANPRHIPSLLLMADHRIVAEQYGEAEDSLSEVRGVNPASPEAWAYYAAVAHLRNQPSGERTSRAEALKPWPENPLVDHIIGRVLSQKYRFAEGAAYQRSALAMDKDYLPAKAQLATDLLRLGESSEGWMLAQEVSVRDEFNVEAFNLVTLQETMQKYTTLTSGDFIVRMTSREAAVYGPRVLALLTKAHQQLSEKYGFQPVKPTTVEIFADQRDFAVRTFGVPDVPGYLGVCFGRVVTANSPAVNVGAPVNWESVLWHEFCHVITLQMTNNKMPRWLSEGISVYEERQANPAWGDQLSPEYRDLILNGRMTPVSQLSSAFLAPPSPQALQFAYYQSSLVVEYIIEKHGLDSLKAILRAVGIGMDINAAIAANTTSMANVEREFTAFARTRAEGLGKGLDWTKPPASLVESGDEAKFSEWAGENPDNFYALTWRARQLTEAQNWAEAVPVLERLLALYPEQTGADSPWKMLAAAFHAQGNTAGERTALSALARLDPAASDVYLRLMELAEAQQDWTALAENAERFLAVNPLVAPPYRQLGTASAKLADLPTAIGAYRTLLELDPQNPATEHYQLASWLQQTGESESARRHVLRALEDAPRFREALTLLQQITGCCEPAEPEPAPAPAAETAPVAPPPAS
ncbi:MAG TPA: tetratricopeptide repeat protein [Opitutaceae bacterium]